MDLVDTLRKKIDVLTDGDYIAGLKAVLMHIETAFRHLSRGQDTEDDTAYTDAIYRTNQAFEGSIKEAYRVLAGHDPGKKTPYDIENYLEKSSVFRKRVLSQLTTYRTEWRNPSTHDYKLDFDESEAFLAIVSVSAFACLLLDQIAEKLAFDKAQGEAEAQKVALARALKPTEHADLVSRVSDLIFQYGSKHVPTPSTSSARVSEAQLIGGLHGFLASAAPELQVETEVLLNNLTFADLIIGRDLERCVVEVKRDRQDGKSDQTLSRGIQQIQRYMVASGIPNGILAYIPDSPSEMQPMMTLNLSEGGQVTIIKALSNKSSHVTT